MSANRLRQHREEAEPALRRPPEPPPEVGLGPGGRPLLPGAPEALLEQVRFHDGGIQAGERRRAPPLLALEARGVLHPEEQGPLEGRLLRIRELSPHLPTDGFHRVCGVTAITLLVEFGGFQRFRLLVGGDVTSLPVSCTCR
jgi:hypothetical protein